MVQVSRNMVHLAGLDDLVHVIEGPAAELLKRLYDEGNITAGGVDLVFFDHWEKHYVPDLQLCEQLGIFREGSLAIADNTDMPGAPDYLKYVRAGGTGSVKYESKGYGSETKTKGPISIFPYSVLESWLTQLRKSSRSALLSRLSWLSFGLLLLCLWAFFLFSSPYSSMMIDEYFLQWVCVCFNMVFILLQILSFLISYLLVQCLHHQGRIYGNPSVLLKRFIQKK